MTFTGTQAILARKGSGKSHTGLHRAVFERLDGAKRRLLYPLIGAWPRDMSNEELAASAQYTVNGHYANLRGRLHSLGLITYPSGGRVRAADLLFPVSR